MGGVVKHKPAELLQLDARTWLGGWSPQRQPTATQNNKASLARGSSEKHVVMIERPEKQKRRRYS